MLVTIRPRGSALDASQASAPLVQPAIDPTSTFDPAQRTQENLALASELKDRGNALFAVRDYAGAASAFSSALRIAQRGSTLHASVLANRSAAYLQWNQPELAAADAQAAIILQPAQTAKGYYRLGQALDAMGQRGLAVHACEWGARECAGASACQLAQLDEFKCALLAAGSATCGGPGSAVPGAFTTRVRVRSPRRRASKGSAPELSMTTETRRFELLSAGDSGVFLQTLSLVLNIPRARLKVICLGKLLRDSNALGLVRAAIASLDGKELVLVVMGEPTEDESDVDARGVGIVQTQLGLSSRAEAISRLRASGGDVLGALLL
jgi:hypothetical protein